MFTLMRHRRKGRKKMTASEFDCIAWRSGMWIAIGEIQTDVVSVDLRAREIAFEDEKGLVWVNSEFVTLKQSK